MSSLSFIFKHLRNITAFSIILLTAVFTIQAAPGDLDTTFGTNGKVLTPVGAGSEAVQDIAIQPDGKIIAVGQTQTGNLTDLALARYNADGILDATFGTNGKVVVSFSAFEEGAAVAIQPDGKIVVVGRGDNDEAAFGSAQISRFNADGSVDTNFGNGTGFVVRAFGSNTSARFRDVAVQADGKIIAVGYVTMPNQRFLVARFNSDGSLENSYLSVPSSGFINEFINAVAIQPDGKIIVGGRSIAGSSSGKWLRLNTNLTVEGNAQGIFAPIGIENIAFQPDGKIVFGGVFTVARYNADKTLDTTFGNNGWNFADFGASTEGKGLALQPDGKIILGGSITQTDENFALARFNSNGFLDVGFGASGKLILPFAAGNDRINSLALQSADRVVAAGFAFNGANDDFALARFNAGNSATIPNNTPFDFDGDGRADTTVFRNGNWYILQSLDNTFKAVAFGQSGDVIVPADYDADGRTDTAVFRPSNANWYILRSSDNAFVAARFGTGDSIPRPGDFDGDGKADIAVFYPPNGTWYLLESRFGTTRTVTFGLGTDIPVIANFDGDARDDIAVFRPSNGTWYWLQSSNGGFRAAVFGQSGDLPVPGDYDGDGKTDLAVFRSSDGGWYQLRSTSGFSAVNFGLGTDRPAAADYDGDGKTDVAVFRSSNGVWYELQSTNGFAAVAWGTSGDVPAQSAYVP